MKRKNLSRPKCFLMQLTDYVYEDLIDVTFSGKYRYPTPVCAVFWRESGVNNIFSDFIVRTEPWLLISYYSKTLILFHH
jgi:hypothetical protein